MIEAKRIPAIPTEYKGITFRSKLEAKYAKAFDKLSIPWLYEEVNFEFSDGTCYAPDFYFPESRQFFEVKGIMTTNDLQKIENLARTGNDVVVGNGKGDLIYYEFYPENHDFALWKDMIYVRECQECHTRYFMCEYGAWNCHNPNCPGDDHPKYNPYITGIDQFKRVYGQSCNLFDEVFDD